MRLLGIDFGSKRVGIAVSDEQQEYAFPKSVLPNDKKLIEKIAALCIELEIEKVVVGDSKDYNREPNKIMEKVVPFVEELRLITRLPIEMQDEMMTSMEAVHLQGKNELLDASAAALILKSYIDTHKKQ